MSKMLFEGAIFATSLATLYLVLNLTCLLDDTCATLEGFIP